LFNISFWTILEKYIENPDSKKVLKKVLPSIVIKEILIHSSIFPFGLFLKNILRTQIQRRFSRKASIDCHKGNIEQGLNRVANISFMTILEKMLRTFMKKFSTKNQKSYKYFLCNKI